MTTPITARTRPARSVIAETATNFVEADFAEIEGRFAAHTYHETGRYGGDTRIIQNLPKPHYPLPARTRDRLRLMLAWKRIGYHDGQLANLPGPYRDYVLDDGAVYEQFKYDPRCNVSMYGHEYTEPELLSAWGLITYWRNRRRGLAS